MSFKLLAIRPLKGCSSSLRKSLNENCIYKFYNEYSYLNKEGQKLDLYKDDFKNEVKYENYKKSLSSLEIDSITYKNEVVDDLYGENINISAVVGKNGSGKSTLLELLYFLIHCYSYKYELSKSVDILTDIAACIEIITLEDNDNKIVITKLSKGKFDKNIIFTQNKFELDDTSNTYNFYPTESNVDLAGFIDFYSIVINYSIYGLNSLNNKDKWLNNLFHQTDSYQSPITINPFKGNGNIDINNEFRLANSRLLKFFSDSYNKNFYFLDSKISADNVLFKIDLGKFNIVHGREKYNDIQEIVNSIIKPINITYNDFMNEFLKLYSKEYNQQNDNEDYFNSLEVKDNNYFERLTYLYIFKKIHKIVINYEEYKLYKKIFNQNPFIDESTIDLYLKFLDISDVQNHTFNVNTASLNYFLYLFQSRLVEQLPIAFVEEEINTIYEDLINKLNSLSEINFKKYLYDKLNYTFNTNEVRIKLLKHLFKTLYNDKSHVTLKLRQAVDLLDYKITNLFAIEEPSEENNIIYLKPKNLKELISKENEFPNAYLEPQFYFKKEGNSDSFELKYLSSGEQQMLHSLVGIKYHIDNILSNHYSNNKKLRYHNINLILDEIELYYHPDFQKKYIYNILNLLNNEQYKDLNFNIIFSTHSPFILSDIPTQNVLKLEAGFPKVDSNGINSFGSNIHDLLADEFFLANSPIGDYALIRIEKLFERLNSDGYIDIKEMDLIHKEINMIGEKVIRNPLLELYNRKLKKSIKDKDELINYYKNIIRRLEE